jgi:hypothetical protein
MFLTKANHTRTLQFCVNLKYETQNSISKCGAEPKKGEKSKTWVGRKNQYLCSSSSKNRKFIY